MSLLQATFSTNPEIYGFTSVSLAREPGGSKKQMNK